MKKTDKSIHNICIASIKRSTIKPYDFKWTKFYENNADFPYSELEIELADNELYICSTFIDNNNFSILTSKRLVTKQDGQLCSENILGATNKLCGNFKRGEDENNYIFGQIQLPSGNVLKYFIETGNASMVMIYGVRTLIRTNTMTPNQVDTIARAWNNRLNK